MCVQKMKKKVDTDNGFGSLPPFTFSGEAKWVLGDLFAHHPPGEGNLWEMVGENSEDTTTDGTKQRPGDIFSRPSMTKAEIARRLEALASRMNNVSNLKQVLFLSLSFQLQKPTCMSFVGEPIYLNFVG